MAVAGFVAFGALGLSPTSTTRWPPSTGVVAAVARVVAGIAALLCCCGWPRLDAPAPSAAGATPPGAAGERSWSPAARRALAVGAAVLGRRPGSTDVVDTARGGTELPRPGPTVAGVPARTRSRAVPGLTPYITPNVDFYRIDTALLVPRSTWPTWS